MSDTDLQLLNAPIVEAVLDIECDMPPGQSIASLEAPGRDRFRDRYPVFRAQLIQEHQIEANPDGARITPGRQGVQGLQFLQEDGKQLVQLRVQGYSFNRLAPYASLDDYLPEIERTWRLFVELASPIQIRHVQLRYINRILLPMPDGKVDLDEYLAVAPHLPDEGKLVFEGFLNQHAAAEIETGNRVNIVLTGQPPENGKLPIIFDNCVSASGPGDPDDWSWILLRVRQLRLLKNRIFKNTLTPKCLDLFQQR